MGTRRASHDRARASARRRTLTLLLTTCLVLAAALAYGDRASAAEVLTPVTPLPAEDTGAMDTGQTLRLTVDTVTSTPADATVTATGTVGVTELSGEVNVGLVVDVSGSTNGPSGQDCNGDGDAGNDPDDANGDGTKGTTLDCEIIGIEALVDSVGGATNVDVALIPFSSGATAEDLDPVTAGDQPLVGIEADADANGVVDVIDAARTLSSGGGTDFNDALAALVAAFAGEPAGETNLAFFLSDGKAGLDTSPPAPVLDAAAAGIKINTFSIGTGAEGCGADEELFMIADLTGGVCEEVLDPTGISAALLGTSPEGVDGVEVSFGPASVAASINAITGAWTATLPDDGVSTTLTSVATATDTAATTATVVVELQRTEEPDDPDDPDDGEDPDDPEDGDDPDDGDDTTDTDDTTTDDTTDGTTTAAASDTTSAASGSDGDLPFTGASILGLMAAAALLLGGGFGVSRLGRRGRQSR